MSNQKLVNCSAWNLSNWLLSWLNNELSSRIELGWYLLSIQRLLLPTSYDINPTPIYLTNLLSQ